MIGIVIIGRELEPLLQSNLMRTWQRAQQQLAHVEFKVLVITNQLAEAGRHLQGVPGVVYACAGFTDPSRGSAAGCRARGLQIGRALGVTTFGFLDGDMRPSARFFDALRNTDSLTSNGELVVGDRFDLSQTGHRWRVRRRISPRVNKNGWVGRIYGSFILKPSVGFEMPLTFDEEEQWLLIRAHANDYRVTYQPFIFVHHFDRVNAKGRALRLLTSNRLTGFWHGWMQIRAARELRVAARIYSRDLAFMMLLIVLVALAPFFISVPALALWRRPAQSLVLGLPKALMFKMPERGAS